MADKKQQAISQAMSQNAEPESIWDKAARLSRGAEAQSRFTRTPMIIRNPEISLQEMFNSLKAQDLIRNRNIPVVPKFMESEGEYHPGNRSIDIGLHGLNPSYQDLQRTIHHEDIHALLEKAGLYNPVIGDSDVRSKAFQSLGLANRAGDYIKESPAYVGAYDPSQMPQFTPEDRQNWISQFIKTLPDETANLYKRIISNYNASQGQLPTQAYGVK